MSLSGAIEPDRLDRDRQRERRYGVLLALAVFISLILLDRPLVRGDGLSYYMWLEPIAVHRSFELEYAAAKFGGVNEYQIFRAPNGKWASAFPFGPAVFLSPWYLAGQALPNVTNVDDDHFAKYQADTFFHSFIVMLGSNFYTVLAALLAYKTSLRLRASPFWAAFAALALIWGTPLIFYSTVEPYMAHSIGAFLVSLLFALLTLRRVPWFLAGLCVSLAILVRWQLALVAVPLLVLLLWRRQLAPTLRFLLGIASLAWLVPLSWYSMFGSPFVVPAAVQNSRPFLGWPVHALDVLFAANNGLFAWAPLTAMSTLGLILLWCRGARAFVLVALSAFVLQVLINGGVSD